MNTKKERLRRASDKGNYQRKRNLGLVLSTLRKKCQAQRKRLRNRTHLKIIRVSIRSNSHWGLNQTTMARQNKTSPSTSKARQSLRLSTQSMTT